MARLLRKQKNKKGGGAAVGLPTIVQELEQQLSLKTLAERGEGSARMALVPSTQEGPQGGERT
jgi:hypothetical protein